MAVDQVVHGQPRCTERAAASGAGEKDCSHLLSAQRRGPDLVCSSFELLQQLGCLRLYFRVHLRLQDGLQNLRLGLCKIKKCGVKTFCEQVLASVSDRRGFTWKNFVSSGFSRIWSSSPSSSYPLGTIMIETYMCRLAADVFKECSDTRDGRSDRANIFLHCPVTLSS